MEGINGNHSQIGGKQTDGPSIKRLCGGVAFALTIAAIGTAIASRVTKSREWRLAGGVTGLSLGAVASEVLICPSKELSIGERVGAVFESNEDELPSALGSQKPEDLIGVLQEITSAAQQTPPIKEEALEQFLQRLALAINQLKQVERLDLTSLTAAPALKSLAARYPKMVQLKELTLGYESFQNMKHLDLSNLDVLHICLSGRNWQLTLVPLTALFKQPERCPKRLIVELPLTAKEEWVKMLAKHLPPKCESFTLIINHPSPDNLYQTFQTELALKDTGHSVTFGCKGRGECANPPNFGAHISCWHQGTLHEG